MPKVKGVLAFAAVSEIATGVACWPGSPLLGMVSYSVAAALYLAYIGFAGGPRGILLWPAVVAHVVLAVLLSRELARGTETRT